VLNVYISFKPIISSITGNQLELFLYESETIFSVEEISRTR
jgi:hypothetical protein